MPIGGFGSELNDKRMETALSIAASALSLATKREPVSSETGNETTDNPGTNQPRQLKKCLICLAQDAAGRWRCSVLLSIVLESFDYHHGRIIRRLAIKNNSGAIL